VSFIVEYKQAIIIRRDLKMGAGKAAVQAAHASVEAVFLILESPNRSWREWLEKWRFSGQKKIALRADSFTDLVATYNKAKNMGLPSVIIRDAGLTQLPPGTATAVAIGPAPEEEVDRITRDMRLF